MSSMIITRAPLRIPLGGGGTDFPSYYKKYGGYLSAFALDKYVYVAMHETLDSKIRLKYSLNEEVDSIDNLRNRVAAEALKYYDLTKGVEIVTVSDVPECSGLGGSSAFCVALVTAIRELLNLPLIKADIFRDSYLIERERAGLPGGIQDQYFATMGRAWELFLYDTVSTKELDVSKILPYLYLVYTGSRDGNLFIAERQDNRVECEDAGILQNLEEVKYLAYKVSKQVIGGDYKALAISFSEHWELKKERDRNVTNPRIDSLYEKALFDGALGGKLIGLGGGGYLLLCSEIPLENGLHIGVDTEGCKVLYRG